MICWVGMRGGFSSSDQSSMERDSFDDISSEEMLVMAADNINIEGDNSGDEEEPTKTLIVTNVDSGIFLDELTKSEFESEFLAFDKTAAFYYIRWVFLIPVNDECERLTSNHCLSAEPSDE